MERTLTDRSNGIGQLDLGQANAACKCPLADGLNRSGDLDGGHSSAIVECVICNAHDGSDVILIVRVFVFDRRNGNLFGNDDSVRLSLADVAGDHSGVTACLFKGEDTGIGYLSIIGSNVIVNGGQIALGSLASNQCCEHSKNHYHGKNLFHMELLLNISIHD